MAQVSGAAVAPMIANGAAEAQAAAVPKTAMSGTWTMDASGIQWAFEEMGRTAFAGILPPTSAKIQMKSTLKPAPSWSERATST